MRRYYEVITAGVDAGDMMKEIKDKKDSSNWQLNPSRALAFLARHCENHIGCEGDGDSYRLLRAAIKEVHTYMKS